MLDVNSEHLGHSETELSFTYLLLELLMYVVSCTDDHVKALSHRLLKVWAASCEKSVAQFDIDLMITGLADSN